MIATYKRVSTIEQNTDRQDFNIDGAIPFTDKISGSTLLAERPDGKKLMNLIKEGNVTELHVHSIDRLGRNTIDILTTIKLITSYNCNVISQKEGLRMLVDGKPNPIANLMIGILSTLAEFELTNIKERQREGIEKAKNKKVYVGRAPGTNEPNEVFFNKAKTKEILKYLKAGESVRRTAKLSGASTTLVQKVIKLTSNK
jgi:DNA invertase Pin-like site-specific DNA recombinase